MNANDPSESHESPLFCDHCLRAMAAGNGEFYVVKIEAFADPTPPSLTEGSLPREFASEWNEVVRQLQDLSPREAMDQVHRQVTIRLCNACYRGWIENPTGS